MRILAALAVAVALLLGLPGEGAIRLPSIKNKLIELALDQISSPGSFEITVEGIEDSPDGGTSLLGLAVSDGEGVWLRAERFTFAWQPTRLAAGELAIDRLEMAGLHVLRPPAPGAEPPELKPQPAWRRGFFDWPRAPIAVVIAEMRIIGARIEAGVLARPLAFDAEGHAFDRGPLQEIALAVRRTDEVPGRIEVELRRDFDAGTARLVLRAEEGPGGLVAAYAGLPAESGTRLELVGDGPPDDWRLTLAGKADGVIEAEGTARLAWAERLAARAALRLVPGPALAPAVRDALGERATLDLDVEEAAAGVIAVRSARLASAALEVEATGRFARTAGPGGAETDLALHLAATGALVAFTEAVAFERLGFEGRLAGPPGALRAEGRLTLAGLATAPADAAALALALEGEETPGGLEARLAGEADGLRLDRLGPEVLGPAHLDAALALEGRRLRVARLTVAARPVEIAGRGEYDLDTTAGTAELTAVAPEMAPVAAAYGLDLAGAGRIEAEAALAPEGDRARLALILEDISYGHAAAAGRLRLAAGLSGALRSPARGVAFTLSGTGAGVRAAELPPDLLRTLSLDGAGRFAAGELTLERLALEAPAARAELAGDIALEARQLALDYRVGVAEVAPLAAAGGVALAGALEAEGRIEGALDAPTLAGRARLAEAALGARPLGPLVLEHRLALAPGVSGDLALALSGGPYGDARAKARIRLGGSRLELGGLEAEGLGARLAGDLAIALDGPLAEGAVTIAAPDLSRLAPLTGPGLRGALEGRLDLEAATGRQAAALDLALRRLARGDIAVERLDLDARAENLFGEARLRAALSAGGVQAGPATLATARLDARGTPRALDLRASAEGTLNAGPRPLPLAVNLAGRARRGDAGLALRLSEATVTAGEDRVALARPLDVRMAGGSVRLEGMDLMLPEGGRLTGDIAAHPAGLTGDLRLAALSMPLLARWAALPFAAGSLDAEARFDTRPARAGAELAVRAAGLQPAGELADLGGGGALSGEATARWDGRRLAARASLSGDFGAPLAAEAVLPLQATAGGLPRLPRDGPIEGRLRWQGEIGRVWALVPAPGHLLEGAADIDLGVAGTLRAPRLTGSLALSDGRYQWLEGGTLIDRLALTTRIDEAGRLHLVLDGRDGAEGRVGGEITIDPGAGLAIDAALRAERAVLVRRDDLRAEIDGTARLAGTPAALRLEAELRVTRAEVRLVNRIPPEIVELEGVRLAGESTPAPAARKPGRLDLDIRVTAERGIFVRGRGLDSEWRLDLAVTGDARAPVVTGRAEKLRGRLDFLGRAFELERGSIVFDGGTRADPVLDIVFEREAHGIRGSIIIEGRASKPALRFASVPALPPGEVLPRLLFGRTSAALGPAEAVQLASGLATLMGGGGGVLDRVREATGLDVLRIEGESVEEATVTVGRSLADGVFVGARQGLAGQGGAVVVEIEVFDGVVLDSEVSPERGANIGITLQKDF